ncbi:MAG: hypothetical protein ACPIOQ_81700, partial [Promethearchaeia archaeon]
MVQGHGDTSKCKRYAGSEEERIACFAATPCLRMDELMAREILGAHPRLDEVTHARRYENPWPVACDFGILGLLC